LQFAQLMAIVEAAPPPGTTPTAEQTRDLITKTAAVYEGIRIGGAAVRGLSFELPDGAARLAAARLTTLENGKIAELALEGFEGKAPQGPVKLGALPSRGSTSQISCERRRCSQGRTRTPRPNSFSRCCCSL